jgi:hypothetical protein
VSIKYRPSGSVKVKMLQRIASLDVPGRLSSYNDKYVIVYDFKDVGMLSYN